MDQNHSKCNDSLYSKIVKKKRENTNKTNTLTNKVKKVNVQVVKKIVI